MDSITVRNLEDGLKHRLRIRAAENGRSMEEEARDILRRRANAWQIAIGRISKLS